MILRTQTSKASCFLSRSLANALFFIMCLQNLPVVDKHCVMNTPNRLAKTTSDRFCQGLKRLSCGGLGSRNHSY